MPESIRSNSLPVVVVGASSAGLFAAEQLARGGLPVHVYEQAPAEAWLAAEPAPGASAPPGGAGRSLPDQAQAAARHPSPRSLIVTPELGRVLGFLPAPAVLHRVHTLELRANGRAVPVALRDPDLVVERNALLRLLARRAEQAGARLLPGHQFLGFDDAWPAPRLLFRRRGGDLCRVAARAVVAADGAHSDVARRLGLPAHPLVSVLQARVRLPEAHDPAVGTVWFGVRDTPYFYWLVPDSPTHGVVGLVDREPRAARGRLDAFLARRGLLPLEYQAARVPLYRPWPAPRARAGELPVLFVGDAAGQVKVTTVGGTVSGLHGAAAAARALLRGSDYLRELGPLTRELQLHWLIREVLHRLGPHEYELLLCHLKGPVGRMLQHHNRDRLANVVLRLLATAPSLLLLAGRALVRAPARS